MREETLYSVRPSRDGRSAEISKWEGEERPVEIYRVTGERCTCTGWMRHGRCKHLEMLRRVRESGLSWTGSFYDYERDLLYSPSDGEGVPTRGAVDIEALADAIGREIR